MARDWSNAWKSGLPQRSSQCKCIALDTQSPTCKSRTVHCKCAQTQSSSKSMDPHSYKAKICTFYHSLQSMLRLRASCSLNISFSRYVRRHLWYQCCCAGVLDECNSFIYLGRRSLQENHKDNSKRSINRYIELPKLSFIFIIARCVFFFSFLPPPPRPPQFISFNPLAP